MSAAAIVGQARNPILTPKAWRVARSPAFTWTALPALGAWAILAVFGRGDGWLASPLCLSPSASVVEGWSANIAASLAGFDPARWTAAALLMTAAMMLPLAAPMITHVTGRSFVARRRRSVGLFVFGFSAVWLFALALTTGVMLLVQSGLAGTGAASFLAPVLGLAAAAWQCSAAKVRAVNRCHGVVPLRARGKAADRDAMAFGLLHGRRCVGACLPAMAPLLAAPHGLLQMAAVSAVLFAERARPYPQYRISAVILLLVGLNAALA